MSGRKYKNMIAEVDNLQAEIDGYRPISKESLGQLREYFRIGLTYASNAIEGNTLTETETKVVLEDGLTIAGKPLREHYEASGHADAYDYVHSISENQEISEGDILEVHRLFYHRIDDAQAGQYRKNPVVITGTTYLPPPPSKVPNLMKDTVAQMKLNRARAHPIEYAAHFHSALVDIHPFVDGNGRTARLIMNLCLFQAGYGIVIIPPVLRGDYIRLVKASQLDESNQQDFVDFVSSVAAESSRDYLRLLKSLHTN